MKNSLTLIQKITSLVKDSKDDPATLTKICKRLASFLKSDITSVYVVEQNGYRLVANKGFDPEKAKNVFLHQGRGLVHHIIETGYPLCLRKATSHRSFHYVQGLGEESYNGYTGLPIRLENNILGALIVQYKREKDTTNDELSLLEIVTDLIAPLITHFIPKVKEKSTEVRSEIEGAGLVPGIFCGKAKTKFYREDVKPQITEMSSIGEKAEHERLKQARDQVLASLNKLLKNERNRDAKEILSTHITLAADAQLLKREEKVLKEGKTAEAAVMTAIQEIADSFERIKDDYLRQRSKDIHDIGRRLLAALRNDGGDKVSEKEPVVFLVDSMPPSMVIEQGAKTFGGLVMVEESPYSHSVILARSLGIPTVLITSDQLAIVADAEEIMVDGSTGLVVADPDATWMEGYIKSHAIETNESMDVKPPLLSVDGEEFKLGVNGVFPRDVEKLPPWVDEVGLFRTEFQMFLSPRLLDEEEQTKAYSEVLNAAGNRPVTLRILDIGGDKCPPSLSFAHEENPMMGERSIRYLLNDSSRFLAHLRAMLKAKVETGGQLKILIPMVAIYEEVSRIRDHLAKEIRDLRRQNIRVRVPPVGAMIEIPSSAYLIPKLAKIVDFFSIGTNDLLQYFMAADRNNSAVSHLCRWQHPGFLSLMGEIAQACQESGKSFSACGEMGNELWGCLILFGLGFHQFSMDRQALPGHLELLRHANRHKLQRLIRNLLKCDTSLEIIESLNLFLDNWKECPESLSKNLKDELNIMLEMNSI